MNKVILVGRVGKAPDYTQTAGGVQVAKFGLATSESVKDKQGVWTKKTLWHRIIYFGKKAELISSMLDKGSMVVVSGRIDYNEYTKDGVTKQQINIIGDDFTVMLAPRDNNEQPTKKNFDDVGPPPLNDEDIPF